MKIEVTSVPIEGADVVKALLESLWHPLCRYILTFVVLFLGMLYICNKSSEKDGGSRLGELYT